MKSAAIARLWRRVADELWTRPGQNFAALDGLRGFGSVIVLFYHCVMFTGYFDPHGPQAAQAAWLPGFANGFWSGIDIFFVLSGFLIGRMLIRDLERDGRLYYPSFFIRRGFRIFPAYYLVLSASLFLIAPLDIPVFRFLYLTDAWRTVAEAAWSNYLYVVNYVRPGNTPSPMSWAWSLSVEEHFYAFLPPLLYLVYRIRRPGVRPVVIALVGGAPLVGRALQYLADPSIELMKGFYYYSHNRFDEVFVGVMIAYYYVTKREAFRAFAERHRHVLWVAGVACVGTVWVFGGLQGKTGAFAIVAQFTLMALGAGFLVINCLFLDNGVTRFFAHRLWYPLARVSYGTYLIHPFVLFGFLALHLRDAPLTALEPWDVIGFFFLVLVTTTLLASLMFVLLEAPLLRVGMRMSARSRARAGAWDARPAQG